MEAIRGFFDSLEVAPLDVGVLVIYLLLMVSIGIICRKASSNISDYVRMGNKGTWWLIGLSIFMQAVSAITFTANCGVAYLAGWSVLWTAIGGVVGLLVHAFFLAGWMRKTRAVTPADTIRRRFGPVMEQIFVYFGVAGSMLWGGVFLLGLATFISAAFNLPVEGVIIFTGMVVIFYAVSGGSWSVMIADNLNAIIMVPICIALMVLALREVGWVSGLLVGIQERGLAGDFKLIKEPAHEYLSTAGRVGKGYFTSMWIGAFISMGIVRSTMMTQCHRYLSAKTCRDAHKAAFFAAALMMIGAFIWFTPALVARVLYEDDVEALAAQSVVVEQSGAAAEDAAGGELAETPEPARPSSRAQLSNPADGAYAVVAKKLLPKGLLGLIMVAMFAAAMSSIDSFLTGTAGTVGKNIYPPLMRAFGKKPWEGRALLRLTKCVNFCLGIWAIFLAIYLHRSSGGGGIYEITLKIFLLVGTPLGLPYALAFFARKLPSWAPIAGMSCGLAFSCLFMFGKELPLGALGALFSDAQNVGEMMWHHRMYVMVSATLLPTYATSLFWKSSPPEHKKRVAKFFTMLKTPIDFEEEVGEAGDHTLLNIVGGLGLVVSGLVLTLLFWMKNTPDRLAVLFVAGVIGGISLSMYLGGKAKAKVEKGKWGSHKDVEI